LKKKCFCTGSCSAVGISATELFEALCVLECFYGLLDMSHCGAFTLKCNWHTRLTGMS